MTPRSKPTRILALAPGRREFGLAVFTGIELTNFSLRSFRNVRSDRAVINEVVTLMRELIDCFDPGAVAVRSISKYQRTSSILQPISQVLRREATINNIPFVEVTINQIKSTLSNDEKSTKIEAFRQLAHLYPELIHFIDLPNQWQNQYYNNLIMAVSVGAALLRIQNQKPLD